MKGVLLSLFFLFGALAPAAHASDADDLIRQIQNQLNSGESAPAPAAAPEPARPAPKKAPARPARTIQHHADRQPASRMPARVKRTVESETPKKKEKAKEPTKQAEAPKEEKAEGGEPELTPAQIAQREHDKAGYWFGKPVPKALMREFSTDRPDKTESPFTVDAGHFQFETDLVAYTQERGDDGTLTKSFNFNQMNLKYGLTNFADFQLIAPTFNTVRTETAGVVDTHSGYGDTTLRLKLNFFGNEGGPVAAGLIPFVKLPTAANGLGNGFTEGGLVLPIALALPGGWSAGFMIELDENHNQSNDRYHAEFISSLTVGHELPAGFEFYTEIFSQSSAEDGAPWIATFDAGLSYSLAANVKLDTGINLGITSAAEDLNPFLGLSFRF